jgi:hypothetical protein
LTLDVRRSRPLKQTSKGGATGAERNMQNT